MQYLGNGEIKILKDGEYKKLKYFVNEENPKPNLWDEKAWDIKSLRYIFKCLTNNAKFSLFCEQKSSAS